MAGGQDLDQLSEKELACRLIVPDRGSKKMSWFTQSE